MDAARTMVMLPTDPDKNMAHAYRVGIRAFAQCLYDLTKKEDGQYHDYADNLVEWIDSLDPLD